MEIKKIVTDKILTVELSGRLDAVTSLDLDGELKKSFDGMDKIIFDLKDLNYIASAGFVEVSKKVRKRRLADDNKKCSA